MEINRLKKKISTYLREALEEQVQVNGKTETKNGLIAKALVGFALNEKLNPGIRLGAIETIMERLEGKPIQPNINADVTLNPLADVDTAKLEALKVKLFDFKKPDGQ